MNASNPIFQYWYFHLPNLILATLMYVALGRFLLGLIFNEKSDNFIWRSFVWMTNPIVRIVSFLTPAAVPSAIILLLCVVWLFGLRVLFLILLIAAGIGPTTGLNPQ